MTLGRRRVVLALVALLGLLAWRSETRLGEPGWRRIQAEYFDRAVETSRARLAVLGAESAEDVRFLEGEVAVAADKASARAEEAAEARRRLLSLERKLRSAEARQRGADETAVTSEEYETARRQAEGYREQAEIQRQALEEIERGVVRARQELAAERAPQAALEAEIDALDGVRGWLRRVPVLRVLGAGIGLRRIGTQATEPLAGERCVTCHLSMALEPGRSDASPLGPAVPSSGSSSDEGWGRLFAPHPSPGLYLAASSPHPAGEFGCTSCHGGNRLETGFAAAGHVPRDEEAERRWREQWRWRPQPPSVAPLAIQAGPRVESSCVSCHDPPWLLGAPVQEAGRLLVRSMGCAACHETGRPDLEPSAPSLTDLPARKRPAWVASFLADPSAWKTTFMPHFWSAEVPQDERDAEVAAVVAWLWRHGDRPLEDAAEQGREPEPASADEELVAAGRRTWRSMACDACHVADPSIERAALLGSQRLRGPNLARLAAEVRPETLLGALETLLESHRPGFAWRQGEVAALAAYLGSLGKAESPPAAVLAADPAARDRVLRRRLLEVTTYEDADARLERAGAAERELLLGELAVRRLRCGACHRLPDVPPAFSEAGTPAAGPPAAGPLVGFGDTPDAGDPILAGTWSHGAAHGAGSSGLPVWRLAAPEAEALAVQLAGWRRPAGRPARVAGAVRSGRDVIARVGCRACHDLDGRKPAAIERRAVPPSLARAGEKLRGEWIFDHLADPAATSIRASLPSWDGLRMPRFDLSAADRSAVAEYFAARAGTPVLTPKIDPPAAAERALGAAVYQVLLCDRCHAGGAESDGETGVHDVRTPWVESPSYAQSGRRLRPAWLRAWLLDPHRWSDAAGLGESAMPAPFPKRDGQPDAAYLLAALDAPMFDVQSQRLERFYAGRAELEAAFRDPQRVAEALAAYVLTLGD